MAKILECAKVDPSSGCQHVVRGETEQEVLQKAGGDERFTTEQPESRFDEVDGDVLARTKEIARWRDGGEVAFWQPK